MAHGAWRKVQSSEPHSAERKANYFKVFWKFVIILRYRMAHGAESMAHGAESMAHGAESMAHGAESMAHGAESMAQSAERKANYFKVFWKFVIILRYRMAHGAEREAFHPFKLLWNFVIILHK